MTTEDMRSRWAASETAWAGWLLVERPSSAEVLAAAGFDAVVVDLQHGSATLQDLPPILGAIEGTPATPFVRTAWNDPAELMRVLDLGVRGVICPMIGSRDEAEAFVRACRYPPDGTRSYGPIRGAFGAGHEQTRTANEEILLFAMIETAEGLADLEMIATTTGLDGLFVGPADLSLATGLESFADLTDPELLEMLDVVVDAAERHELVAGIHAPVAERAAEMAARGFRFVSCVVDADLMGEGAAGDADLLREGAAAALRAVRGAR
jgi:4-hydroxy-2-oxoheptanedioate aldolase